MNLGLDSGGLGPLRSYPLCLVSFLVGSPALCGVQAGITSQKSMLSLADLVI